jgi:gas vesicle protein
MKKREEVKYHKSESNFASGLLWGVIIGAIGMFFFATKKGKKLKNYLSEHGEKIFEELEELYEEKEVGKKIKKLVEPQTKANKIKEKQDDATEDLTHIAKLQERGRKAARNFFTRRGKSLR